MKIFLDSANTKEIRSAVSMGLIDGINTDPSLIAREGRNFDLIIREICVLFEGPICVEAVSQGWKELVEEGRTLASLNPNIVVKASLTGDSMRAVRVLAAEGIKTNMTLCFSPLQALLAAKAGATYVSPCIGQLDDVSQDGMELIEKTLRIFNNYDLPTQLLVSTVRSPTHVLDSALMNADVCSVPYDVLMKLVRHPLTDAGIDRFLEHWRAVPKN